MYFPGKAIDYITVIQYYHSMNNTDITKASFLLKQSSKKMRAVARISKEFPDLLNVDMFRTGPKFPSSRPPRLGSLGSKALGDARSVTSGDVFNSRMQGLGYGRKIYGSAIRKAYEDYLTGGPRWFTSDKSHRTSEKAQNLWKGLKRHGYPVQTLPVDFPAPRYHAMFGVDLEDMKKFYKDVT